MQPQVSLESEEKIHQDIYEETFEKVVERSREPVKGVPPDIQKLIGQIKQMDKNRGVVNIGVSFSGEVLRISRDYTDSIDALYYEVSKQLNADAQKVILLTADGQEPTIEMINIQNDPIKIHLFAFSMNENQNKFDCNKEILLETLKVPKMEQIGNSSMTIDQQLNLLEKRVAQLISILIEFVDHFRVLEEAFRKNQNMIHVIFASHRAATLNFQMHRDAIEKEIEGTINEASGITRDVSVLLERCSVDYILMKIIPLETNGKYLIDLAKTEWKDIYRNCAFERDELLDFINSSIECWQRIPTSIMELAEIDSFSAQITELSGEIQRLDQCITAGKLVSLQKNNKIERDLSENLILVQKSSRLLNLAELASKLNENYLQEIVSFYTFFRSALDVQEPHLRNLQTKVRECLLDVIEYQEQLSNVILQSSMMKDKMFNLRNHKPTLEQIHAFPIAYVALLCEMVRRENFSKSVKDEFSGVESLLETYLQKENARRQEFMLALAKIINPDTFVSICQDSECSGNVVLYLSEEESNRNRDSLAQLEEIVINEERMLPHNDPVKKQLAKFIESIMQMKKQVQNIGQVIKLGPAHDITEKEPKQADDRNQGSDLVLVYEQRIRQLEELLRQKYIKETEVERIEKAPIQEHFNRTGEESEWSSIFNLISDKIANESSESRDYVKRAILERLDHHGSSVERKELISFSDFQIGELVLFLPTVREGIWSIFNISCPHYYLQHNSLLKMRSKMETSDWIVGRISDIRRKTSEGKTLNPYRLPKDFEYFEVEAEVATISEKIRSAINS